MTRFYKAGPDLVGATLVPCCADNLTANGLADPLLMFSRVVMAWLNDQNALDWKLY